VIRFRAPVRREDDGYVVALSDDEAQLVQRLLDELRDLLTDDEQGELTARLFPVVHPDDPEQEAEYQRWMRPDLVESKLAAIDTVERSLSGDRRLDEGGMIAFMQAVNSVRLVLGTMLGLTDEDQPDEDDAESTNEMQLYVYLSWLLEWSVRALSA
jgi:hypothetical protein